MKKFTTPQISIGYVFLMLFFGVVLLFLPSVIIVGCAGVVSVIFVAIMMQRSGTMDA